jgi:hypothetical protein
VAAVLFPLSAYQTQRIAATNTRSVKTYAALSAVANTPHPISSKTRDAIMTMGEEY